MNHRRERKVLHSLVLYECVLALNVLVSKTGKELLDSFS